MKLRKGFTLVELLIVIVIIGILAGAMLLASGAATASAEASNIVNNLRSLNSASLLFYADNMDELLDPAAPSPLVRLGRAPNDIQNLLDYTNNPAAPVWDNYEFIFADGIGDAHAAQVWWASANVARGDVATRLEGRSGSVGLYSQAYDSDDLVGLAPDYVAPGAQVFMLLRNPAAADNP